MKMNKIIWHCIGAWIVLASLPDTRADEAADHNALRAIKATYEEAVKSGMPAKLAPHVSTNTTGVMVTGEQVEGMAGLESYWKKIQNLIGPGGTYEVAVNVDKTDLFGDLALSRGTTADIVRLGNGKEFKFGSSWSTVCRKEGGAWKVIRMQATMDPVQNPFVSA